MQQGDPLGPLLFSMVIQELITAIATECKLSLNLWYLDDGVLAGLAAQAHKAFRLIQRMGPELGLELNVGKTELVTYFGGTPDPLDAAGRRRSGAGARGQEAAAQLGHRRQVRARRVARALSPRPAQAKGRQI